MPKESSLVFAGIAPHPPIMVPEVGREAISEVRGSIDAMAELTRRIIASGAESLIMISPHAPLEPDAFVAYDDPKLHGDFANFRAPEAAIEAPLDYELLKVIAELASDENLDIVPVGNAFLDHGTAVPLYFLQHNGWVGRVVALGYSFLSKSDHLRFGACLKRAADALGRPVALVASGDLSHRLKPNAPAGYNPTAYVFDEQVLEALRTNAPEQIIDIDPQLRKLAGECGYRSMLVALGATRDLPPNCEVLHYEAPFGVGYMVAQLTAKHRRAEDLDPRGETSSEDLRELLPRLARKTIETYVVSGERPSLQQTEIEALSMRAACFVSIKTISGDLRGCIGTIEPAENSLAEELMSNAIGAAVRDPRFPPVSADELSNLRYSVDILSTAEPARFEDLDPLSYGVIVEDELGLRGLLLPDIEGVETAAQQVEIAARKAGIPPGRPLKFSRFKVERYPEKI